jgi:hypothetical protein
MQYSIKRIVGRILGWLGTQCLSAAERICPEWDDQWATLRQSIQAHMAEVDAGWDQRHLPAVPSVALQDDEKETGRIMLPSRLRKATKRKLYIGGKLVSVIIPPGSWLGIGGDS